MNGRKTTGLKNRFHILTAVFAAGLFANSGIAEEKAKTDGPSSVWVAEKDGNRIYLVGTIHLLREKDYPLPEVFEQAYSDSKKLVFELPPGSDGANEVAQRMQKMGSYPGNDDLGTHIAPDTLKQVLGWAEKKSVPVSTIKGYRPWFLSLIIASVEYRALGAVADRGLDTWFEKLAAKDGKPGAGLETVEYQLSLFSSLSDKIQEQLLLQTLEETVSMKKNFDELLAAWRGGDLEKLHEIMFRDADKFPDLIENFLNKRNQAWIAPIMQHLSDGGHVMVLIGAGHLGGKAGVLELLKAKGCTIRQLGQ